MKNLLFVSCACYYLHFTLLFSTRSRTVPDTLIQQRRLILQHCAFNVFKPFFSGFSSPLVFRTEVCIGGFILFRSGRFSRPIPHDIPSQRAVFPVEGLYPFTLLNGPVNERHFTYSFCD